jgi:Ca-activated chloride channel family protein
MRRLSKYSSLLIAIFSLLSFTIPARAQEASPPLKVDARNQTTVRLNLLVLDGKNNSVTDLRQDDFQVFEGDAPQTISFFSKEDMPVSYGLLIDSSGSLRTQFMGVLRAGRTIITGNQPNDETFLVSFVSSDRLTLMQDFTADKDALRVQLNGIKVEGGQTAIIDAVYTAVEHLSKSKQDAGPRRRALILITDGEDRSSAFSKEELVKLLHKSDVQIFVIGMVNELDKDSGLIRKSPREKAVKLLEEMAKESGGYVFFARSSSDLEAIATKITRALHTQYVIGYTPTGTASKDSYRKVRVKLVDAPGRDKLKVIARPGYNVPRL